MNIPIRLRSEWMMIGIRHNSAIRIAKRIVISNGGACDEAAHHQPEQRVTPRRTGCRLRHLQFGVAFGVERRQDVCSFHVHTPFTFQ